MVGGNFEPVVGCLELNLAALNKPAGRLDGNIQTPIQLLRGDVILHMSKTLFRLDFSTC